MTFLHFFEVSAIHQNQAAGSGDEAGSDGEDGEGEDEEAQQAEIDEALRLFTKGMNRPISLHDLRDVARTLKEDVDESVLRAMILEANGNKGVNRGVGRDEFAELGARAGVFR